MSLREKLRLADFESEFERLSKDKLSKIFGGGSCNRTGSSSKCDKTAVCNCPAPPPPKDPPPLNPDPSC